MLNVLSGLDTAAEHLLAQADRLTQALEEVSALLVEHFPIEPGTVSPNELPDAVVRA